MYIGRVAVRRINHGLTDCYHAAKFVFRVNLVSQLYSFCRSHQLIVCCRKHHSWITGGHTCPKPAGHIHAVNFIKSNPVLHLALAMYFGSSAGVKMFQDEGIDTIFLPFFSQNSEPWIMTTPYFQVALNRDLEQDTARREKAMKVLNVMLSEQAQNRIVSEGQDILSYSQNVPLRLTEYLKDVRSVVEENHMYIRIASNDFFAVSKDVVSKMIAGELTAEQAYQAFNAKLLADEEPADNETVLTSGKAYSNVFHANGGSAAFSVMANTLRGVYGTDVLLATANSFTGSVRQAD